MKTILGIFLVCLLAGSQQTYAAEKQGFQFTKQPDLQQIRPKKPVKIKLRRTAKDEYSWELSGDDVEEIVRADNRLRKMLNIK